MTEENFRIKAEADVAQATTAFNRLLGQMLSLNQRMKTQNALTAQLVSQNTAAAEATNKHQSSLRSLALRFVGYNLLLNEVVSWHRKLVEGVQESVAAHRELELRMAEVASIMTDDMLGSINRLEAGIVNLSLTYGKSTSDLTKGLYDILSAAFSATDAMNLLNTSTKAVMAGLSDTRTSVDIFTTVLNAYGKTVAQAQNVSDILFESVIRGKFQFEDLESALGYVVPIAAQAGIAFDELMASLSTATRFGLHLDMASRGLAMAIQNIVSPSEEAKKMAAKYGVALDDLTLRVKGLKSWFDEVREASNEFGKRVLTDIMPNIRSLRIAMVLAGDEGAQGFADDLEYLTLAAGRTNGALEKIMNTSKIASDKIAQDMEKWKREVGSAWDEGVLRIQSGIVDIAKNWKAFIPVIGQGLVLFDKMGEMKFADWAKGIEEAFPKTENLQQNAAAYLTLLSMADDISNQMQGMDTGSAEYANLNRQLEVLNRMLAELQMSYNSFVGGIDDVNEALENQTTNLTEIEIAIDDLNKELRNSQTYGWGNYQKTIDGTLYYEMALLKAEQQMTDVQHDVNMGLVDATYVWKTQNDELKTAVDYVREYQKMQDNAKKSTDEMTIAMRKLQIAMLEIQLKGMMRRRGLTRMEEQRLKKLEIEQAKLRLANMKAEAEETVEMYSEYNDRKSYIEQFLAKLEEESYQLKYSYDVQIADLQTTIDNEEALLKERQDLWNTTITNIVSYTDTGMQLLTDIMKNPDLYNAMKEQGMQVDELYAKYQRLNLEASAQQVIPTITPTATGAGIVKIKKQGIPIYGTSADIPVQSASTKYLSRLGGFQRGTEYVPETRPYMLHRGEWVGAPGAETAGGDTYITIQYDNVNINTEMDIHTLAAAQARLIKSNMVNGKTGKTKYRFRTG